MEHLVRREGETSLGCILNPVAGSNNLAFLPKYDMIFCTLFDYSGSIRVLIFGH